MLAIIIASRLSRVRKEIKAYKSMDTARKSSTPNGNEYAAYSHLVLCDIRAQRVNQCNDEQLKSALCIVARKSAGYARYREKYEQNYGVYYISNTACAAVYPVVAKRRKRIADASAHEVEAVPLIAEIRPQQDCQMVENHKDDAHAAKEVDFPDSVALAPRCEGDSSVLAYQRIFF